MKNVVIALTLLLPLHLSASDLSKAEKVNALVEVMNLDEMLDSMNIQINNMIGSMHTQLEVSESERPLFEEYHQQVLAIMQAELSWEQFEPMIVNIYNKHFSEEEITESLTEESKKQLADLEGQIAELNKKKLPTGRIVGLEDICWVLLNRNEFLFNH